MIRRFAAVVVALALVGALASCSKKDSGLTDVSSDTTVTTTGSSRETTTTTKSTTKDTKATKDSKDKGRGNDLPANLEDCAIASQFFASILGTGSFMGGITDEQTQELRDEIEQLQDSVPQELRDDFATVATAYQELMEIFSGADASDYLDEGFQQKLEDAAEGMDSPEVTAAVDNIETYFEQNCS